ncbi:MAG: type II toxin-antitoxin system HicA family toxin [Dehalococcoidales bacterium]|jgi:predicted RNA binding protein YcfA (HicA-like mRNA interferase family)|nr:type II toxin-antitoxin system HicA family toxin [Dehalococcoidales bacterium]
MKRNELVKRIEKSGSILIRHGSKHDWYQNPETKVAQPIPRHREISDSLAKHILKMLNAG